MQMLLLAWKMRERANVMSTKRGSRQDNDKRVADKHSAARHPADPFARAENEDDDGYDPYSDRLPDPEPMFERDPWN